MNVDPIRPIIVEQEIRPEGAQSDAASFLQAAESIQEYTAILQDEMIQLEQALEDAHQIQMLDELAPILSKLETLAATLRIHAASIETKTVTIKNTIWVGTHQVHPLTPSTNPNITQSQEGYDPPPP